MKYLILGSYGEGNFGDEAILKAVIKNVREADDKADISVFTHDMKESKHLHKSENVKFFPIIATVIRSFLKQIIRGEFRTNLKLIKDADLIIVGGGGIFYDKETAIGINPLLIWWLRFSLFRLILKKVVIYAVGIGSVKKESSKFFLKQICKVAHKVIVRDITSLDKLKSHNVKDVYI